MERAPQPQSVTTAAEFIAMLRRLRRWADLSLRDLERRAVLEGGALPRATVSGILNRTELPREEFVAAYVRACGGDAYSVEIWLAARRRLAVASEALPAPPTTIGRPMAESPWEASDDNGSPAAAAEDLADERGSSRIPSQARRHVTARPVRRRRALLIAGAVTAVAALTLGTLGTTDDDSTRRSPSASGARTTPMPAKSASSSPSSKAPSPRRLLEPGACRMRTADGRCVVERREESKEVEAIGLFLTPCTTSQSDSVILKETGNGAYRIIFPGRQHEARRCLGVHGASIQDGMAVVIGYCGTQELIEAEQFRLEKVSLHGGGFRLRPDHLRFVPEDQRQDLCLGAPEADHKEWAFVSQLQCLSDSPRQVFRFLK